MRFGTMILSLVVAGLVAVNAPAQEKKEPPKKPSLAERFAKMDTNNDGILTEQEFVAFHKAAHEGKGKGNGEAKAGTFYKELATLGGTTTKDNVTGMNVDQFKKAHKQWRENHPKKDQGKK